MGFSEDIIRRVMANNKDGDYFIEQCIYEDKSNSK